MRNDIAKAICECYRSGTRWDSSSSHAMRAAKRDLQVDQFEDELDVVDDFGPSKIGIKARRHGSGHKYFNDNLAPVIGYLRKSVGRHWDAVYAEMKAAGLSGSGVLQQHVIGHVFDYVTVKTWQDERGNIFGASGYGGQPRFIQGPDREEYRNWYSYRSNRDYDFFVHPVTGILTRPERIKEEKKLARYYHPVVLVDNKNGFVHYHDTWMRMTYFKLVGKNQQANLAIIRKHIGDARMVDQWSGAEKSSVEDACHVSGGWEREYGEKIFILDYQPANSKEIQKHKLREVERDRLRPAEPNNWAPRRPFIASKLLPACLQGRGMQDTIQV